MALVESLPGNGLCLYCDCFNSWIINFYCCDLLTYSWTDLSRDLQLGKENGEQVLCSVYKFRRLICYAVRFWIVQFPVHFDMDPKLSTIMKDWQKWLTEQDYVELASLVDLSCLPSYDWIRNISVRDPSVKHCRKVSLVFNHLEPSELAKHLTYLEHRIMRRISVNILFIWILKPSRHVS